MSRLVCSFWSLWLKFIWLFPFSSYETWIPKIFTGLCNHFRCKGLLLFFFPLTQPDRFCFFFQVNFKPASIPKFSTVSKAISTEFVIRNLSHSLRSLVRFPILYQLLRKCALSMKRGPGKEVAFEFEPIRIVITKSTL